MGASTRGQVEARRNGSSLPHSQQSSNLRVQKALQLRALTTTVTLMIPRKRKSASRRSPFLNLSFPISVVQRPIPVNARPRPQQIRIQTSAMKLWGLSIRTPQFGHRVHPCTKWSGLPTALSCTLLSSLGSSLSGLASTISLKERISENRR